MSIQNLVPNVHSSIIHNSQKIDNTNVCQLTNVNKTKCWYIHVTEYLTNKKNEVPATTQIKFEHIMLSPKSQS